MLKALSRNWYHFFSTPPTHNSHLYSTQLYAIKSNISNMPDVKMVFFCRYSWYVYLHSNIQLSHYCFLSFLLSLSYAILSFSIAFMNHPCMTSQVVPKITNTVITSWCLVVWNKIIWRNENTHATNGEYRYKCKLCLLPIIERILSLRWKDFPNASIPYTISKLPK